MARKKTDKSGVSLWDFVQDTRLKSSTRPKTRPRSSKWGKKVKVPNRSWERWEKTYDDFVVEKAPRFSQHAQKRLKAGRQGKFICRPNRKRNQMIVVTVLPRGKSHNIPLCHRPRKLCMKHKLEQYLGK